MSTSRLENDVDLLTDDEKTAIRAGLVTLQHFSGRLAGDLPRMSRGSAASDLNRMTGIVSKMRGTLLEFADKPDHDSQLSRFIDIMRP